MRTENGRSALRSRRGNSISAASVRVPISAVTRRLCALAACAYMTLLGKKGIREIAEINWDRADYLRQKIAKLKNFEVDTGPTVFNEFRVKSKKPFAKIEEKLSRQGFSRRGVSRPSIPS